VHLFHKTQSVKRKAQNNNVKPQATIDEYHVDVHPLLDEKITIKINGKF